MNPLIRSNGFCWIRVGAEKGIGFVACSKNSDMSHRPARVATVTTDGLIWLKILFLNAQMNMEITMTTEPAIII